ncbi:hypothetical protein B0H17DRAFT_1148091 [Mycena rosella]|uniref:Uncharacterized protein n=1 Tax=Mycena rosella TaxID=1033263 RepID=A0AAD7CGR5_MYCRO|nr:hypothetical protein B0H17DRAFT_1148091 [Mycena rosella]
MTIIYVWPGLKSSDVRVGSGLKAWAWAGSGGLGLEKIPDPTRARYQMIFSTPLFNHQSIKMIRPTIATCQATFKSFGGATAFGGAEGVVAQGTKFSLFARALSDLAAFCAGVGLLPFLDSGFFVPEPIMVPIYRSCGGDSIEN